MSATVPRYFAFERSVGRDCGMRLSLHVWHYSRWSEVQTARCCGCGKVQCYVPKGDDPCVLNAAGANRAVEAPGEVVNWLGQWAFWSRVMLEFNRRGCWLAFGATPSEVLRC